jgi:hypothetical protein
MQALFFRQPVPSKKVRKQHENHGDAVNKL